MPGVLEPEQMAVPRGSGAAGGGRPFRPAWSGLVLLATLLAGCGGDGSPAAPTTPKPPDALASVTSITVRGTITETLRGGQVGTFTEEVPRLPASITVSAPGFLDRRTLVASATPTVDLIRDADPFDLEFYRQLVRNGFEEPDQLRSLLRLSSAPAFYMQTTADGGGNVPTGTLATVRAHAPLALEAWSGLTPSAWEEGPQGRPRATGWIVIRFADEPESTFCGRAFVGAAAGEITFNVGNPSCRCGSQGIGPRTVLHEVGHAAGFWHVDGSGARIMSGFVGGSTFFCTLNEVSGLETHHAAIAYARPPGSLDVDVDPNASTLGSRTLDGPLIVD